MLIKLRERKIPFTTGRNIQPRSQDRLKNRCRVRTGNEENKI